MEKIRCTWVKGRQNEIHYHDTEWGVPLMDDDKLFEFLLLDTFQAGLSWQTILDKREGFKKAFDNFNANKIAKYDETKMELLMQDAGIIRNKLKIKAAISNANLFLQVKKEYGSFEKYIWQFTNHKTIDGKRRRMRDVPAFTAESDAMSKDLKKRGFKFVGTTICYAFMQAAGMINDHSMDCFRYKEIQKLARK